MFELKQLFDGEWYDIGNVQVPDDMLFSQILGENPNNNGPHNELGEIEGVHLNASLLPPHEHDKYLNDVGKCYHAFSNSAHKFMLYFDDVYLPAGGKYKLSLNVVGDYVGAGEDKPPQHDPEHAQVTLFADDKTHSQYMIRNDEDLIETEFILNPGIYDLGFEIFVQWAIGGGNWGNGCFIKSFSVTKVQDLYNVYTILLPQEATLEETKDAVIYAYDNKRSFVYSADDAIRLQQNPLADENSCIYVYLLDYPSQQEAVERFDELGINWEVLHV